jgi:outer membrane receptor protein involved in Fe transport
MLRKANIAIALSLTLPALAQQSFAQTASPKVVANNPVVGASQLSEVTVSATRSPRKVDDVPSSVSVITGARRI